MSSFESYQKSEFQSIKHSTYFDVYDHLFSRYVGKPVTFVEVGVLGGGSLMMWRDFFGPDARIIGIDLNPEAQEFRELGFEIFIGDQADPRFWQTFTRQVGPIHILLDDGGHTYKQQVVTSSSMLESVVDGGLLVVEDTHTSYMMGFGPRKFSFVKYAHAMADSINLRFSELSQEKRMNISEVVWSIEFFDSIVCFHVDRSRARAKSFPVENLPGTKTIHDFRYGLALTSLSRKIAGFALIQRFLASENSLRIASWLLRPIFWLFNSTRVWADWSYLVHFKRQKRSGSEK